MIKHGFSKCGACHTDPSGGETLTGMGRAGAAQLLSFGAGAESPNALSRFAFGAVPEPPGVRLGGSYRHMLMYAAARGGADGELVHFPMQADVYGAGTWDLLIAGGSIGVARGIKGSAHVRGAQLNRELEEGWLLLSRTHFVGLRLDEANVVRLGRLNLPFGLRVPEHVLWAREATRTDRESDQQHGLAFAHAGGRWRFEGMLIAGNYQLYPDRYRERGYSMSAEYLVAHRAAIGLSSLLTRANEDRFTQARGKLRHAQAVHGRLGLSQHWALWGEVDLLRDGGRGLGHAALLQVDYEPLRGLHFMVTGEMLDRGDLSGAAPDASSASTRLGAWLSSLVYLYSHLELRLDIVYRQESALATQAQLHLFL